MVDCALRPGVIAVCKIFHINETAKQIIDVISEEGKVWTKGKYELSIENIVTYHHFTIEQEHNFLKFYFYSYCSKP